VSANLIFPTYCHSDIPCLKTNLLRQRAENFLCVRSSLLESAIVTEFQAAEAYSSFDLTKAKYGISRMAMVENENVIVRSNPNNFNAREKRKST
jgi:hypothetical protein